jgi:hypothetical protein
MSSREERLARNESVFRLINEQISKVSNPPRRDIDLVCECAATKCIQPLHMNHQEYERLRQNPRRFAVLPGHEIPDIETVVERNDRYLVVEKHVETHEQVENTDPRSD